MLAFIFQLVPAVSYKLATIATRCRTQSGAIDSHPWWVGAFLTPMAGATMDGAFKVRGLDKFRHTQTLKHIYLPYLRNRSATTKTYKRSRNIPQCRTYIQENPTRTRTQGNV